MIGKNLKKFIENELIVGILPYHNYEQLKKLVSLFEEEKYDIEFYIELIKNKKVSEILKSIINNKELLENCLNSENSHIIDLIDVYTSNLDIDLYKYDDTSYYEEDGTKRYLREICTKPLLSKEEEKEYFLKLKNGEEKYRNIIVERNLKLVVSIAKKYANRGLSLDDLIEEGNIGLIVAIEKFDINRDIKFASYATWWIRHYIMEAIYEKVRLIKLPDHMHEYLTKYNRIFDTLSIKLGRTPKIEEINEVLNLSEENIKLVQTYRHDVSSLNERVGEDDSVLADLVADDVNVEEKIVNKITGEEIKTLFYVLDEKEKRILFFRYGFVDGKPRSLREISEKLNVSTERVRKLEARALRKLREEIKRVNSKKGIENSNKNIFEYLDFYDIEIIRRVINQLDDEDIELLNIAFGESYCNSINLNILDKFELKRIENKLIPILKNFIMKEQKNKKIEKKQNFEEEYVEIKIDTEIPSFKEQIKTNEDKFIVHENAFNKNYLKLSIYEYLSTIPEYYINNELKNISEEYKKIVYLRFGVDLKNPQISKEWFIDEAKNFKILYLTIIPNIRRNWINSIDYKIEKSKNIKTIYELLSKYSREDINNVLQDLSEEERYIVYLRYGSELDNPITSRDWFINEKQNNYILYSSIIPKLKRKLSKNYSTKKREKKTLDIKYIDNEQRKKRLNQIKSLNFNYLKGFVTEEELNIFLKLCVGNSSLVQIQEIFNKSEKEIIEIYQKVALLVNEMLSNTADESLEYLADYDNIDKLILEKK